MSISLPAFAPENLVSLHGFGSPVTRQPAYLHTLAEPGAYLRDSSRVPRWRPFMKPPYAIGSVPSLSGHAIAYRWRSLLRVRRHRASKPQGSSERVLPWQVAMDQLTYASLSHTHYCYEVSTLKVPAIIIKQFRLFSKRSNDKNGNSYELCLSRKWKMRVSIIIVLWPDKLQPVIYISIRPNHPTAVSRNIMNRLSLAR